MNSAEQRNLLSALKQAKLFSGVSEEFILGLLPQFIQVTLRQGEILFYLDDPSDFVYILLKGDLSAVMEKDGKELIIGMIHPGETVGELGVLSGLSRGLTVRAVTEAHLVGLSGYAFGQICQEEPSILTHTMIPIVNRSLQTIKFLRGEVSLCRISVFLSVDNDEKTQIFKNKITEIISQHQRTKLVNEKNISANKYVSYIELAEQRNFDHLIFFIDKIDDNSLEFLMDKGSDFYLTADGRTRIIVNHEMNKFLQVINRHPKTKLRLILLYIDGNTTPAYTKAWLDRYKFFLHHHVRMDHEEDYQRLSRFIEGTAYGLVLGGGGSKGYLHLGVIKTLLEKKIPIDMIGGTSIGAVAGACYALTESFAETQDKFHILIEKCYQVLSFRHVVWPLVSLFSSNPVTHSAQEIFAKIEIENLWLPFYCTSSNLSEYCEVVHRAGPLWIALRSSASTPGIVPPVVIRGRLHVDGGLLNNLPVDVMKKILGPNGKIIASKLSNQHPDKYKYDFPPVLSLKQTILSKLNFASESSYRFPNYLEMFMTSLLLGASSKERENALMADLLVNPDLSDFRTFGRLKKRENKLIDLGYFETLKALKNTPLI
ncbi:MAG: patatin-like phospholipase family protein [Gammaproteobacteria bacterium]